MNSRTIASFVFASVAAFSARAEDVIGWTIDENMVITEVMTEAETAAGLKPWILNGSGSLPKSNIAVDGVAQTGDHTTLDLRKLIKRVSTGGTVTISSGYKSSVFASKTTIKKLILPDDMSFSGSCQKLFQNCSGIESVEPMFPDGMTWVPARTFEGCTSLEGEAVLNNVTEIGIWAFSKTKIGSVVMGPKCKTIGYDAFDGCTMLSNVVINATNGWSTSSSTGKMFNGCTALRTFTMMTFPATIYSTDFSPYTAKSTYAANKYKICFFVPKDIVDEKGLLTEGITPWDDLDDDVKAGFKARWADMGVKKALGVINDTQTSGASYHYGTYTLPANQFIAYIPDTKSGMKVLFK